MRRRSGDIRAAAVLAAALSVVGCASGGGSTASDSTAQPISGPPTTGGVPRGLPDTCAVSADLLRGFRLQPDTASRLDVTNWDICSWSAEEGQPYSAAGVAVSTMSYQSLLTSPGLDRFAPTRVGGRDATTYWRVGDEKYDCKLAWSTSTGVAGVDVYAHTSHATTWSDPCQYVQGWAEAVFPLLPK